MGRAFLCAVGFLTRLPAPQWSSESWHGVSGGGTNGGDPGKPVEGDVGGTTDPARQGVGTARRTIGAG